MVTQKKLARKRFTPYDTEDDMEYWVPRVHLMFLAEDPRVFARRLSNAYKLREVTESCLRCVRACARTCVYVCVCACVCVCVVCLCTYVFTYVHTYMHMYVCIYVHTYVRMYVFLHTLVYAGTISMWTVCLWIL